MGNIADNIGTVLGKLRSTFEVWRPQPKGKQKTPQELQQSVDDANGLLDIIDSRGIDAIRRRLKEKFDQYDSYLRNMEAKDHQGPDGTEAKGMARAAESALRIFNDIIEDGRIAEATIQSVRDAAERAEQKKKGSRVHPLSSVRSNQTS